MMARSTYIYLVTTKSGLVLSVHTVKHEALTWIRRCGWPISELHFFQMKDGIEGTAHDLNGKRIKVRQSISLREVNNEDR